MGEVIKFTPRLEGAYPAVGNLALTRLPKTGRGFVGGEGVVVDFGERERRKSAYEHIKGGLSWQSGTREYVNFFNQFSREEGLPDDWESLRYGDTQVGFSIKAQMELLQGSDANSRKIWAGQTKRDMQGYILEYLSPHNVYPWHHEKTVNNDGTYSLADRRYGKRMVDTVSSDERGGAVLEVLENIDRAVIEGKIPDGSILVQISPMDDSPTGLRQDNGEDVVYSDTHIIFSQVNNGALDGFTVKTDYTKAECRELIKRLTGKVLSDSAPIEDYIRSVALINPSTCPMKSIDDVVSAVASVRFDLSLGSDKVYKERTWDSVLEQIIIGDRLYEYTDHMQAILDTFEKDVIDDSVTDVQIRKYIAATLLRVSQEADMLKSQNVKLERQETGIRSDFTYIASERYPKFGDVLRDAALRPGCAGGGPQKTAVGGSFGITRAVDKGGIDTSGACPEIKCGNCSWKADEQDVKKIQDESMKNCPDCGWSPKKN